VAQNSSSTVRCALDLAVQVRRAGRDGPELDGLGHQPALHLLGEELRPAVRLQTLDREGRLVEDLVEEGQGRRGARAPG
jgi:hypothetical protein